MSYPKLSSCGAQTKPNHMLQQMRTMEPCHMCITPLRAVLSHALIDRATAIKATLQAASIREGSLESQLLHCPLDVPFTIL